MAKYFFNALKFWVRFLNLKSFFACVNLIKVGQDRHSLHKLLFKPKILPLDLKTLGNFFFYDRIVVEEFEEGENPFEIS